MLHEALVALALARGFTVYQVSEQSRLRTLSSPSQQETRLWRLVKRAKQIKLRRQLDTSLRGLDLQVPELSGAMASINRLIHRLAALACELATACGWNASLVRPRTITGVGKLNALALKAMYQRGKSPAVDTTNLVCPLFPGIHGDSQCCYGCQPLCPAGIRRHDGERCF